MTSQSAFALRAQIPKLSKLFQPSASFCTEAVSRAHRTRIERTVNNNKVVVFMKGFPERPYCGFTHVVVDILKLHRVPYSAANVIDDMEVQQSVKEYSHWPSFPQVFIGGKFVGDYSALIEMHKSGKLANLLKSVGLKSAYVPETNDLEGDLKQKISA